MFPWLALPAVRSGLTLGLKIVAFLALAWYADHRFTLWQRNVRDEAVNLRDAQVTAESLRLQLARSKDDLAAERDRLAALTEQLNGVRTDSAQRVAVFNKHRFGDLLQAKPALIESRVNHATAEVWEQIERESQL